MYPIRISLLLGLTTLGYGVTPCRAQSAYDDVFVATETNAARFEILGAYYRSYASPYFDLHAASVELRYRDSARAYYAGLGYRSYFGAQTDFAVQVESQGRAVGLSIELSRTLRQLYFAAGVVPVQGVLRLLGGHAVPTELSLGLGVGASWIHDQGRIKVRPSGLLVAEYPMNFWRGLNVGPSVVFTLDSPSGNAVQLDTDLGLRASWRF